LFLVRCPSPNHPELYYQPGQRCPICEYHEQQAREQPPRTYGREIQLPDRTAQSGGVRLTVAEWCRRQGLGLRTVDARLKRGWTLHQAIFTPKGQCPW